MNAGKKLLAIIFTVVLAVTGIYDGSFAFAENPAGSEPSASSEQSVSPTQATVQQEKPAPDEAGSDAGDQKSESDAGDQDSEAESDNQKDESATDAEENETDSNIEEEQGDQDSDESSDAKAESLQFFTETDEDITVIAAAPEGAFPDGVTMTVKKVDDEDTIQAIRDTLDREEADITAVDITFKDQSGNDIQPDKPVQITIKSDTLTKSENPVIIHVPDEGEPEKLSRKDNKIESDTEKKEVSFKADSFSVYAIVDESTDDYARMVLDFYNGETKIATMYVKEGDSAEDLEIIIYDPGAGTLGEGEMFAGWILDKPNFTSTDVDGAMNIAQIREWAAQQELTEGTTFHRFDAAVCKLYTITYKDTDGMVLGMEAVPVKSGEEGAAAVNCNVNMAYTPKDDTHNFEGWKLDDATNVTSEVPADQIYQNGSSISIKGDISFTVNAPEGHWLVFDENGKGGTYNAPQFVKSEDVTVQPRPDGEMTRNGYTFAGWYTTKAYADAYGNAGKFEFGDTIDSKTTIYAGWKPNTTAPYTVILWGQNADRTAYEVLGSYVNNNGTVGQNIPYTVVENGAEDYVTGVGSGNGHYTGFGLTDTSKNQGVTITPEGDAVLNLYYDRIEYNFKFYLYRNANQNNRYDYANNSGNGSTLDNLVTWHSNQNAHPGLTAAYASSHPIQSETVGGRTYYYFTISAYYGEDISSKWPTYDVITGANSREAVSYVMMVGTKLKPQATSSGTGTVKGIITVMDENILGATNNPNGNYVIVRFPENYNNWRYHIWFEAVDGEDYSGKQTHVYNGKTYYEETVLNVRSSNTTDANQNEPKYPGFDYITRVGQNNQGVWTGGHWTTGNNPTLYHLNYIYDRQQFNITYFDGNYVDGSGNTVQNRATHPLHESSSISHGAIIPDGDRNYVPECPEAGYVFDGWYLDEGCTTPYVWGTMPVGGIKVYAKWRQVQYRVFLHPNAGTDPNLEWGADNVSTCFRVDYGDKISAPTGTRVGSGYEFVGWYTDPSCDSAHLFRPDEVLNDQTVTTPYDQTEETELDKWGNVIPGQEGFNADLNGDRFWITKKVDLYAKWRKVLEGDGVRVVYTADDGNGHVGGNAPSDNSVYPDQADATAQAAATAPAGYEFKCWVVQEWDPDTETYVDTDTTVVPGDKFTILADLAHKEPVTGEEGIFTYTMQLRAEYVKPGEETPTHVWWFPNYPDNTSDRQDASRSDEPLQINLGVDIAEPPSTAGHAEGYEFLGWAKVPASISESTDGTPPTGEVLSYDDIINYLYLKYEGGVFKLNDSTRPAYNGKTVSQVAADETTPYHDMYAVWKKKEYTVTVRKHIQGSAADLTKEFTFTPTNLGDGTEFTLTNYDGTASTQQTYQGVEHNTKIKVKEKDNDYILTGVKVSEFSDPSLDENYFISSVDITNDDEIKVKNHTLVEFYNTKEIIPTGILDRDPWYVLPLLALAGLLLLLGYTALRNRHRRRIAGDR